METLSMSYLTVGISIILKLPVLIQKILTVQDAPFLLAIASQLAKGKSVPDAVKAAKTYVTMAIEHSLAIGKGCGPTHHFYELYQHGLSEE